MKITTPQRTMENQTRLQILQEFVKSDRKLTMIIPKRVIFLHEINNKHLSKTKKLTNSVISCQKLSKCVQNGAMQNQKKLAKSARV